MLPTKYYKLKKKKKKKERKKEVVQKPWFNVYTTQNQTQNMCVCVSIYIYRDKVEKKSNWILIRFSILHHVSYLIFNFVSSELLSVKNELKNGKI